MSQITTPDLQREFGLTNKQMAQYEDGLDAFIFVPRSLVKTALFQLANSFLTTREIETLGNELGRLADEKMRAMR